jgi:hypothetical protein
MTAGGSLTNANWPASRPALPLRARVLHPRSSPALPRANCAPPPTRMSAFSTPPGHYSRSVHDGRERNNTRLLGSQSRAAGQGTLISGPKQFEAVTYSHPVLGHPGQSPSAPEPRMTARRTRQDCCGPSSDLVALGRHPSSFAPHPVRSSLFGLWTRSFSVCRKNEGLS